ncbi:bone marrow stromal antigen 2 isoform X1 [Canis aureus]
MAPTLYHYWPVPITDESESMSSSQKLSWLEWLGILWIPVVMGLSVALIIFVVKTNSKACRDGLLVEQECHNVTSLLERQLTQTRQALQGTMDQATTCNKTVVTLSASLVKEKAWGQEQLTRGEKLQGEIETLKQQLQAALEEVKQLRSEPRPLTIPLSCPFVLPQDHPNPPPKTQASLCLGNPHCSGHKV